MSKYDMNKLLIRIKELEKENTNLKQLLEVKDEQKESNQPLHNGSSTTSTISDTEPISTELHTGNNLPSSSMRLSKSFKVSGR